MADQSVISPVLNGQVIKKARNTSKGQTDQTGAFSFMSVLDSMTPQSGTQDRNTSESGTQIHRSQETHDATEGGTRESSLKAVRFRSTYRASSKTTDTVGNLTDRSTKHPASGNAAVKTQKAAAKPKTSADTASGRDVTRNPAENDTTQVQDDGTDTKSTKAVAADEGTIADDLKTQSDGTDTRTAGPVTEDEEVDEAGFMDELTSDILKTIADDLDVLRQDIIDAMNANGLTVVSLQIPSNVAVLYTSLTGASQADLLTSDTFHSLLDDLSQLFKNLSDTFSQLAGLTEVTPEEADDLSTLLSDSQDDTHSADSTPAGQADVTVLSVTADTDEVQTAAETTGQADVTTAADVTAETAGVQETVKTAQDMPQSDSYDTTGSPEQPQNTAVTQVQQSTSDTQTGTEEGSNLPGNAAKNPLSDTQEVNTNLAGTAATVQSAETPFESVISAVQKYTDINTDSLITQITEKARQTLSSKVSSLEMELHPENLGKIFLQVTEKSGDVSAHIYAQNEAVKHALENRLADLADNLNRQGIRVNEVSISVEPHAFEENLEKDTGGQFGNALDGSASQNAFEDQQGSSGGGAFRSRSSIDLRTSYDGSQLTQSEALEAQIMQDNGNTVSYRI